MSSRQRRKSHWQDKKDTTTKSYRTFLSDSPQLRGSGLALTETSAVDWKPSVRLTVQCAPTPTFISFSSFPSVWVLFLTYLLSFTGCRFQSVSAHIHAIP